MEFSDGNVTAYVDGNARRTKEITFKADELQSIRNIWRMASICPKKTAAETGGDCKTERKARTADGSGGGYGAQTEVRKEGSVWLVLPDASFFMS